MTADPKDNAPKPPFDEKPQNAPAQQRSMRQKPDCGEESYRGLGRLKGRRALITGGDSGIGRAVAIAFAREGADVAIASLAEEANDAEDVLGFLRSAGQKGHRLEGDLSSPETCARIVKEARDALGGLDILVNNAAAQGKAVKGIEELTAERIRRTFDVNIIAMFHLVRESLKHMPEGASIINVASIQSADPSAAILDYATTKGAIVTFTKGLSEELIKRGIRVNAVAPGPVWTPLIAQSFDEDKLREFGKSSPYGRPAQPVELAPAFVFLASQEASYVTGEVLGVTGGRFLP
jgi:NAD(P)-dependent dehydrogenase (short-subunit alcohol dehydrogenase family)